MDFIARETARHLDSVAAQEHFEEWCAGEGVDPDDAESRAWYADAMEPDWEAVAEARAWANEPY